ncbi:MAG TPA: ribbon-helix-helix protein, CopG family [Thermoanaerobaculia bacterium]|nr:ribbon-helix-helix protein, CopG family [Thermoanaerobaculia bacterium]
MSERGPSRSEAVREAIEEYLFVRRLRGLRRRLLPYAQAECLDTDEDIFREIS